MKDNGAPVVPAAADLRNRAGDAHRAGRLAEARAHYAAYLALVPGDAPNWSNLGALLRSEGRHDLALAAQERREADRDEVHFRARAYGPDAQPLELLIVNMSPHGLMARCEAELSEGQRLRLSLPGAGVLTAEIRWALGGRIGCHFATQIDRATYYETLAAMLRR